MNDKFIHFIAGVAVCAFVYPISPIYAVVLTFVVGAAKELRDSRGYGVVEFLDFFATGMGAVTLLAWHYLVEAFRGWVWQV